MLPEPQVPLCHQEVPTCLAQPPGGVSTPCVVGEQQCTRLRTLHNHQAPLRAARALTGESGEERMVGEGRRIRLGLRKRAGGSREERGTDASGGEEEK